VGVVREPRRFLREGPEGRRAHRRGHGLPRQLFARGVNEVRRGNWTIADDGTLYTLPLGSSEVNVGRMDE